MYVTITCFNTKYTNFECPSLAFKQKNQPCSCPSYEGLTKFFSQLPAYRNRNQQKQLSAINSAPAQAEVVRREERVKRRGAWTWEQQPSMQGQVVIGDRMLSTRNSQQLLMGDLFHDCTLGQLNNLFAKDLIN